MATRRVFVIFPGCIKAIQTSETDSEVGGPSGRREIGGTLKEESSLHLSRSAEVPTGHAEASETIFSKIRENLQKLSETVRLYFSRTLPAPIGPGEPVVGAFLEVEHVIKSHENFGLCQNPENSVSGGLRQCGESPRS